MANIIYFDLHKNNNFQESSMLRICDLNQVIKTYAFKMQQRIDELQHFRSYQGRENEQEEDAMIDVVLKYSGKTSTDQKDIKLALRFKERVIQIYDFFKGKSNNQNILTMIQANIQQQLEKFVTQEEVRLGDMLSYVHTITKRGGIVKSTAQRKPIVSRSTIKPSQKISQKAPTYSIFNIQRRPSTSSKWVKTVPIEKGKLNQLADQLWGSIEFDKLHLFRIKEGNEELITKEMLRRNQKIRATIKQNQRRKTYIQTSQELRNSTILSEVKTNALKGLWNVKKRASNYTSNKKNRPAKQNISLFV